MSIITNRKVAGYVPVWAPFNGFSLLFDNPGRSYSCFETFSDLEKLDCSCEGPELEFYRTLWNSCSQAERMIRDYLFCPLPPHSYHVTVWDGINDYNVRKLPDYIREEGERFLRELPDSFRSGSHELTRADGKQVHISAERIEFVYDKLENWNNSSLVVRLKPADSQSERVLLRIVEQRFRLNRLFEERFGFPTASLEYRPHVSLGYFANRDIASRSEQAVEAWDQQLKLITQSQSICFESISLYGFVDMETFFRKA
jgi:hypothetical protein